MAGSLLSYCSACPIYLAIAQLALLANSLPRTYIHVPLSPHAVTLISQPHPLLLRSTSSQLRVAHRALGQPPVALASLRNHSLLLSLLLLVVQAPVQMPKLGVIEEAIGEQLLHTCVCHFRVKRHAAQLTGIQLAPCAVE